MLNQHRLDPRSLAQDTAKILGVALTPDQIECVALVDRSAPNCFHPDSKHVHCRANEKASGRKSIHELERLGHIERNHSYRIDHYTKGTNLSSSIQTCMNAFRDLALLAAQTCTHKVIDNPARLLSSRRLKGNSMRTTTIKACRWIKIDIEALKQINVLPEHAGIHSNLMYTALTSKKRGFLNATYKEDGYGRQYLTCGINLQNLPVYIREAALNNSFNYDIEAAHPNILVQKTIGHYPELEAYVLNPKTLRHKLEYMGLTVKHSKRLVNALLYGAGLRMNGAIHDFIEDEALFKQVKHLPEIQQLYSEVRQAGAELINDSMKGGHLVNAMNHRYKGRKEFGPMLAHILQGYEAKAMEAATSVSDDIELLLFDGFYCRTAIDQIEAEKAIYQATGLHLNLKMEEVKCKTAPKHKLDVGTVVAELLSVSNICINTITDTIRAYTLPPHIYIQVQRVLDLHPNKYIDHHL